MYMHVYAHVHVYVCKVYMYWYTCTCMYNVCVTYPVREQHVNVLTHVQYVQVTVLLYLQTRSHATWYM